MSLRPLTSPSRRALLGESPLWSVAEQALYFVDIKGRAIHRLVPETSDHRIVPVAEDIGCIGFWPGGGFIAAMRSGIWRLGADGSALAKLADNPEDQRVSRFNDGGIDPRGRLLAGTIDEPKDGGKAHLYRYDRHGLSVLAGGLLTSNGVAFSPDGRTLYHADTPRFVVHAYDYDPATGAATNRRVFVQLSPSGDDRGRPDGAAVDAEGCYWTALYEGGRIRRYSPAGELLAEHTLAARRPTMIAFGGPDLKTLFVTTASVDADAAEREAYPDAGCVFAMRVEVPGLPPTVFDPHA
jgi:sugar lactone lactonase YvrE